MTPLMALQALPPIPHWAELHPLVIHFPIALLLVAPVFIAAGIAMKSENGRPFLIAALALMVLGTLGTVMAVLTGEAAAEVAHRTAGMSAVLELHQELAEITRDIFGLLSVIFAAILFVPRFLRRATSPAAARLLPMAFLVFYVAGTVVLVNTAHNGGRLVHEFGAHAFLAPTDQAAHDQHADGGPDNETKHDR
jgi:uncharacterized membrane protein